MLFFSLSFLSTAFSCTCAYAQIFLSCLFTRPSYLFSPQFHVSLLLPPCSHTHKVFKSKDSPCVMLAVGLPSHFIFLPFPSLFCHPPPQNVWIDLNGVIVTALPAVCPSTSASQRLWKVWREQRERKKGKGRGREESSFEQQGMAALQRAKSSVRSRFELQPVLLCLLWLTVLSLYSVLSPTLSL